MNLSGLIAVIEGGQVVEVRDLGPDPIPCKPGAALPLVDNKPPLADRQQYGTPTLEIGEEVVTRHWPVEDIPTDEAYPPLEPWQFWSIVDLCGIGEQTLREAISRVPDAAFKVKALRKLANPPGGKFLRSDPLFNNPFLMEQIGRTKEDIDQLWLAATAIE